MSRVNLGRSWSLKNVHLSAYVLIFSVICLIRDLEPSHQNQNQHIHFYYHTSIYMFTLKAGQELILLEPRPLVTSWNHSRALSEPNRPDVWCYYSCDPDLAGSEQNQQQVYFQFPVKGSAAGCGTPAGERPLQNLTELHRTLVSSF